MSKRRRSGGQALDNRSMLSEVRARDDKIKKLQRQKRKNANEDGLETAAGQSSQTEKEKVVGKKPVPYVRVYDYEQMKREAGWL